jgi:hypothetical protein
MIEIELRPGSPRDTVGALYPKVFDEGDLLLQLNSV